MPILDRRTNQFIEDKDKRVSVGIDFPFARVPNQEGYFATTKTTIESVKNNIRLLLQTQRGERPFQPFLGANLRGLLFEPADALTKIALRENIFDVLKNHEPRIEVQDIDIKDLADQNAYRVLVKMRIKEFDTDDQVEIVLRRLR